MNLIWQVSKADARSCSAFIARHNNKELVKERRRRNVAREDIDATAVSAWRVHLGCLITSQQRSGRGSRVQEFLHSPSPALQLERCLATPRLERFLKEALSRAGLRWTSSVAERAASNIDHFRGQGWVTLSKELERLRLSAALSEEREVAAEVRGRLRGLGPKQSRNFVQWLGLSRYVVPLDSRFINHLNGIGFPIGLSAELLQVEASYRVIEDGVNALAASADVLPCIYDAAVFSSFDADA